MLKTSWEKITAGKTFSSIYIVTKIRDNVTINGREEGEIYGGLDTKYVLKKLPEI